MTKFSKSMLILVAASLQGLLLSQFFFSAGENFQIAGEVPEAGTILLFGVGALILKSKKNR